MPSLQYKADEAFTRILAKWDQLPGFLSTKVKLPVILGGGIGEIWAAATPDDALAFDKMNNIMWRNIEDSQIPAFDMTHA